MRPVVASLLIACSPAVSDGEPLARAPDAFVGRTADGTTFVSSEIADAAAVAEFCKPFAAIRSTP